MIKNTDLRILFSATMALCACGVVSPEGDLGQTDAAKTLAPETIEIGGRVFLRRDLWEPDEFARIMDEGRPTRAKAKSIAVLAAQMRAHARRYGEHYIEVEPAYETARRILSGEAAWPTAAQPPREERGVVGTDSRAHQTSSSYPYTAVAFLENSCTGTKIGARTIATAAHCLYQTKNPTFQEGWICNTGRSGTQCAGVPWPRWRFGVEDGGGYTPWLVSGCDVPIVPTGFMALDDPGDSDDTAAWDFVSWDICVIDLSGCTEYNTGWLGTHVATDQELWDAMGNTSGYPVRAQCPSGSQGELGHTTNGTNIRGTTCPGTGNWPGSTYRYNGDVTAPFSGAEPWGSASASVQPGSQFPEYTIRAAVDVTHGQSGSSLYVFDALGDRKVIGVFSWLSTDHNRYLRWTNEVFDFFEANSDFPDDTQ